MRAELSQALVHCHPGSAACVIGHLALKQNTWGGETDRSLANYKARCSMRRVKMLRDSAFIK